jgi:hypothetical protein
MEPTIKLLRNGVCFELQSLQGANLKKSGVKLAVSPRIYPVRNNALLLCSGVRL